MNQAEDKIQYPSLPIYIQKLKNIDDLFLQEKIEQFNQEFADYLKIFIIGYTSDIGAHNCGSRTGSEQGPQNFREILDQLAYGTDNAYYNVNISTCKMKIYDCGNINFELFNLESAFSQLQTVVSQICANINNSKIVIIGGTDDLVLPCLKGISVLDKIDMINIDSQLDMKNKFKKQLKDEEPTYHEHHQSHFRMIYEDKELIEKIGQITHFGLQGHKVRKGEVEIISQCKSSNVNIVFLEKDIRKVQSQSDHSFTEARMKMIQYLTSANQLYVNLDLSAIKSQFVPGVSEPCPAIGLSLLECEEISMLIGQQKNIKVFSISEYNPAIEKYKTGTALNSIFYHFLIGIAKSIQDQ